MCYGGMDLRDAVRDVEARMAPVARAWHDTRQDAAAAPGWLVRLRRVLAGWMRTGARANPMHARVQRAE